MRGLFLGVLFFIVTGCSTGPSIDYVALVQNAESKVPGVTIKDLITKALQISQSNGNFIKVKGWSYEGRLSDGVCIKLYVSENDKPIDFIWAVDDNDKVRANNKMANDVTK